MLRAIEGLSPFSLFPLFVFVVACIYIGNMYTVTVPIKQLQYVPTSMANKKVWALQSYVYRYTTLLFQYTTVPQCECVIDIVWHFIKSACTTVRPVKPRKPRPQSQCCSRDQSSRNTRQAVTLDKLRSTRRRKTCSNTLRPNVSVQVACALDHCSRCTLNASRPRK